MLYIFTGRAYRSSRRRYPAYLKALNQFTTTAKINPKSPVEKYKSFVKKGLVRSDIHQLKALQQLNKLHEELILYEERLSTSISTELPAESRQNSSSWFSSIFSSTQTIAGNNNSSPSMIHAPKSFYIYGGTGTGKTFLMDLFYDNLTFLKRRRRIHYSNFMLDIHQRLHELKMTDNAKRESFTSSLNRTRAVKKRSSGDSEVHEVWDKISSDIYKESYFICLDEFQVTDIADAVILKNLFASLFDKGVVVIMTSNRPPSDLYQNGLQRDLFLPFIDLVQKRATVHSIVESTIDYRVLKQREQQGKSVYWHPVTDDHEELFRLHFQHYLQPSSEDFNWMTHAVDIDCIPTTSASTLEQEISTKRLLDKIPAEFVPFISPQYFTVMGHKLTVPNVLAGRRVALMSFEELCGNPLGSVDYIELSKRFSVIFLYNVPEIPVQHRNEVRRMILMIDALYEAKTCVFVLAAVPPLKLLQITDEEKAKSLYDEVFAFDRTVSRLIEMQSAEYLKAVALSRKIGASYLQSIGAKLRSLDVQQTDNADINLHIKLFNQIWQEYNVNFDDETSTLRKADLVVLLHDLFYSYFMAMQIKQTIVEQTMVTTSFSNFVSSVFDDTKLNEWSQSDFCALLSRLDWISHNDAYSVK